MPEWQIWCCKWIFWSEKKSKKFDARKDKFDAEIPNLMLRNDYPPEFGSSYQGHKGKDLNWELQYCTTIVLFKCLHEPWITHDPMYIVLVTHDPMYKYWQLCIVFINS